MKTKNKKGVSPIVATTILVGFAVVVTSIVMLFGGELIEDIQQKQGINLEKSLECDSISFKVTNLLQGTRIQVSNNGKQDINAFLVRYIGSEAESIDSHHKVSIKQGGVGEIIAVGSPGIGDLEKVKLYAKSAAGPKGNVIWGTCGNTEATVNLKNA